MTVTKTNTTPITSAPDPPPEPGRDLPSPSRPLPGIPKPGDLPAQPRPGDPSPSEPKPGSPGPIRPQTVATLLLLLVLHCELRAASHFGKMYLRGEVNTHFEKERAEVVVANVPGALDVVNRITAYARWQPKPDEAIEEDAARRLHWSPFLDADQITMTVDDGVVTLRGTVDSWQERKTAGRQVYQAGARRVINELDVRSRQQGAAQSEGVIRFLIKD